MTQKGRAYTLALKFINNSECRLRLFRLKFHVTCTPDNHAATGFFGQRDQGYMVCEVHIQEEICFSIRKMTSDTQEAASAGFDRKIGESLGEVIAIFRFSSTSGQT